MKRTKLREFEHFLSRGSSGEQGLELEESTQAVNFSVDTR
jgi:hypothetical protein